MRYCPILATLAVLLAMAPPAAAQQAVDLELVLAVDVSRSMDFTEQRVQREGYIAAVKHPEVVAAIKSGMLGRIAVTYYEWAGPSSQQVVVPMAAILAIYAQETGQGMMLPEDGGALAEEAPGDAPEPPEDGPKRGGHLRVVK